MDLVGNIVAIMALTLVFWTLIAIALEGFLVVWHRFSVKAPEIAMIHILIAIIGLTWALIIRL